MTGGGAEASAAAHAQSGRKAIGGAGGLGAAASPSRTAPRRGRRRRRAPCSPSRTTPAASRTSPARSHRRAPCVTRNDEVLRASDGRGMRARARVLPHLQPVTTRELSAAHAPSGETVTSDEQHDRSRVRSWRNEARGEASVRRAAPCSVSASSSDRPRASGRRSSSRAQRRRSSVCRLRQPPSGAQSERLLALWRASVARAGQYTSGDTSVTPEPIEWSSLSCRRPTADEAAASVPRAACVVGGRTVSEVTGSESSRSKCVCVQRSTTTPSWKRRYVSAISTARSARSVTSEERSSSSCVQARSSRQQASRRSRSRAARCAASGCTTSGRSIGGACSVRGRDAIGTDAVNVSRNFK
eukprot:1654988-Prymnesium_polylepis.1